MCLCVCVCVCVYVCLRTDEDEHGNRLQGSLADSKDLHHLPPCAQYLTVFTNTHIHTNTQLVCMHASIH